VAQLVTAKTFSSQELEEIKDMLVSKDAIGTKLETTVDSELLGGAILFWRGLMIDGSMKTFLNHLKK
jgi:F0F1-type ATP synthase delta subunit